MLDSISEAFRFNNVLFLVALLTLLAPFAAATFGVLTLKRRRVPWVCWALLPCAILFVVSFDHAAAIVAMIETLASAPAETSQRHWARGAYRVVNMQAVGGFGLAFTALCLTWAIGLSSAVSAPKPRRKTFGAAVIVLAATALAAGASLVAATALSRFPEYKPAVGITLYLGLGLLGTLSAHLMLPEHEAHAPRQAASRFGAVVMLALGAWGCAMFQLALGFRRALQAHETSTPESRLELFVAGEEIARYEHSVVLAGALTFLILGALAAAPTLKLLSEDKRSRWAAAAAVFVLAATFGSSALLHVASSARLEQLELPTGQYGALQYALSSLLKL